MSLWNNLDGLVDDGAVLLWVLLLIDHWLVLGLVVGRRRQGRRVLVHCRAEPEQREMESEWWWHSFGMGLNGIIESYDTRFALHTSLEKCTNFYMSTQKEPSQVV